jgi:hypothetical protein
MLFCNLLFYVNVFETDRKLLALRALCFPPDQLTSSPLAVRDQVI